MTNQELIIATAKAYNIYTESEIAEFLRTTGTLPLHTYSVWQRLGYKIKKDAKGIETKLWKVGKPKEDENNEDAMENEHWYLAKAYLFDKNQVEPIGE